MISSSRPVLFLVLFLAQIVEPIPAQQAHIMIIRLRYVGLMWPFYLIGHFYLSGIYMARFVVKNAHEKRCMCYKEIELCAQNILTTGTIGRVCDHWIRTRIFTWTSYNHSNSETWNDDLYAWFAIANRIGWANSQVHPTVKIVYGVGCAQNRGTYLVLYWLEVQLVPKHASPVAYTFLNSGQCFIWL